MSDPGLPDEQPFQPTHLIVLSELSEQERMEYYEMLIEADGKLYIDPSGVRVADVRILAPGIKKNELELERKKGEKPKLTPRQKLAEVAHRCVTCARSLFRRGGARGM